MTQNGRNPQGITEISIEVGPSDYVHNDMSCWGDFDWKIEKRKETDVVGVVEGFDRLDFEKIWEDRTHKTFAGHSDPHDYPIEVFPLDYETNGKVALMWNLKNQEYPKVKKLLDYLEFEKISLVNFQIQEPGQMTPYHTDQLHRRRGEEEYSDRMWRILIAITPWSFGQVFQYGNETLTHWEGGEIFVPYSKDTPHGGGNFGLVPRIFLNITGVPSDKTYEKFPRWKQILNKEEPTKKCTLFEI